MLDDGNVLAQRDPSDALGVAAAQYTQAAWEAAVAQPEHDGREIARVVVSGMGGSALAANIVKSWLKQVLSVPFEVVRSYDVPGYVDGSTLVIASSHSGNTEETLSSFDQAVERHAAVAVLTGGGTLLERAQAANCAYVQVPNDTQPRMATLYHLRALLKLLAHFGVVDEAYYHEVAEVSEWLHEQSRAWEADVTVDKNFAKQLALLAVGKTPVVYGGTLMAPIAYKWKISFNENAKNVAFTNEIPEFNHNEFMGWASHPVDKPYAVFDLTSECEHERIQKRFEVTDRLLNGKRPKAVDIPLEGETPLRQMLWGCVLADFASIYLGILNGVDPTPVELIERFKAELG